ncbi:hypothetical protein TNCV_2727251 [Trichonephila clavipes]|nr:hypothetical protein TNCV_2727251 [Trichonephila clavipes]
MPPDRRNISSRPSKFIAAKGLIFTPVISRSSEHHIGDSMILLGTTPILRENTLRPPTSLLHPSTSREDLRLDGFLEYSHVAKTLHT